MEVVVSHWLPGVVSAVAGAGRDHPVFQKWEMKFQYEKCSPMLKSSFFLLVMQALVNGTWASTLLSGLPGSVLNKVSGINFHSGNEDINMSNICFHVC